MAKPQGKLFRLLSSRLDKEGCDLFCLSMAFRDVLLDMAERLEWESTWVDGNGERASLSDTQRQVIEEGIQALTMACEIVVQNNITIENTGGGSCGPTAQPYPLPTQVRPDGTTIETICMPVDPTNPTGEYPIETIDDVNLVPPTGWPDWQQFISAKCRAANYMVDALLGVIDSVDEAENRVSILLQIVQTVLELAPVPIEKTSSWNKVIKWVNKLLDFVDDVEGIWDWAQEIAQLIEDKRNEVVCILYSTNDLLFAATGILAATIDDLTAIMVANGLSGNTQALVIEFWETIINDVVPRAYDYEWVLSIPDSYQAPYNCAACGGGDIGNGWLLIPLTYDSLFDSGGQTGISGHNVTNLGSYIRTTCDASNSGLQGWFNTVWSAELAEGLWFYGFHLDTQNLVNADGSGFRDYPDGSGHPELNECDRLDTPPVPLYGITESCLATIFTTDTGIITNVGPACTTGKFQVPANQTFLYSMKIRSVLAGSMSADYKLFGIFRADNITC